MSYVKNKIILHKVVKEIFKKYLCFFQFILYWFKLTK